MSGSIKRSKAWFQVLVSVSLLLVNGLCLAQFNSITKRESSIPVQIILTPADTIISSYLKGAGFDTFEVSKTKEVEDLNKAPAFIKLTSLDKEEALIASKLGAHLPVDNIFLRSSFGYRVHPISKKYTFHTGIDISARSANVYAVLHGGVGSCGYDSRLGYFVTINHGNYTTVYGHLSKIFVNVGDLVKSGEVIGISGATGQATGEHLHFTVRYKGRLIEPLVFLGAIMTATPANLYFTLFN